MNSWGNPAELQVFRCLEFRVSTTAPTIELDYTFERGPTLTERYEFVGGRVPQTQEHLQALHRAASLLHIAAGVSYYKVSAAPKIEIHAGTWSEARASFFERFYRDGLAEFAYRNQVKVAPAFEDQTQQSVSPLPAAPPSQGTAVPLGGGKDSLVTCDLLARESLPFRTIAVGSSKVILRTAAAVGREHIQIRRHLAPEMQALNAAGALNGHVPITGILSFVLLCGGWYYGYDRIVMSNESSADEPTLVDADANEVNHQYAKSMAYEKALAELLETEFDAQACPQYFSLLRPLNETTIARVFAFLEQFHEVFCSCNSNFTLAGQPGTAQWCCRCPKCRFVYLALAPFMRRERLAAIFGVDLLDEASQAEGFEALLGLRSHKPFECVGTVSECQSLMRHLMERVEWRDAAVVKSLAPSLADRDIMGLRQVLKMRGPHRIPEEFMEAVNAIDRA